ncbi:ATPase, histidine kinase-, DNA gyrase B (macronuclear) [Tetrahymena thermophila SB210]|uniref:ATPase, histidine kinase-, DNA gyrase B n=1 Tax=Tetrahymena thermophila (strain SB210) TaxID=312017 RepID=I7MHU5_TETTS|nr:ATPase, histidine kinase-, DNA gyrase B [Tetrahymena thermophila SB210]EAS03285.2 ATPase, histidine kinase-, DNA gyrase B [Tetrahymena thermophila SB210]|eukprot:XP_001023530.2 ATPase, histidine kinase-, DNA gyrase B [Tetrahymena thermophila SB210]
MNGENSSNSIKQSQIEEVKQSLNRITLNFRSKELQQQYELGVYKSKANQLIKIYLLLTLVTAAGIIQYSIKAQSQNNTIFLIDLVSLTFIFALITCLLKYLPKFICLWNLIAILCYNTHVIVLYFLSTNIQTQHDFLGFALISTVACFIVQRYNHNFLLILLSLLTTFASFSLYLEYSLYGFLSIALIISLYSLYQTEYLQRQAFWFERFNCQQNHIIENVVTSSLFYIRYNQKEERLEFQRGNKRFCDKFEVKDDDSMRYFLKNTKISHKSEEQQTINSMWNSVNNNWKSSLDGLIHIKIKEQETKIQTQLNLNVINKQIKDLENEIDKEKNQVSNNQQLIQQQLSNNQTNPQPLSIIESNGQSGYLSHKSSPVQKKNSPKAISKMAAAQATLLQNDINLNEIDKEKQILSRDELDNNLIPSSSYMSRQNINIFSPPNQNRKNYLLTDEQASASKKAYGEDEQEKERDDSKDQSKQMIHKNKKLKRINSGLQNINQPSPQMNLQRTFTWRNNSSDTQVYKAKYTNQAGEKIKFLIRILIFKMNDTYIAVSIEKEEKSKKYKQLKNKIQFFEQVFNQMIKDCDKVSQQEVSVLRKLIQLSSLQQQQIQQLNQTNQNNTNQLSSQLLSLNIECPRRQSIEKNLLKQNTRESSFSISNQEKKEFGSLRQIKQKEQSQITNLNTAATSSHQQDVNATLNQDNNNVLGSVQAFVNTYQNNSLFQINQQTGILKKPSLQCSPVNQQIAYKSSKYITNIQDIPQRISFQVQNNTTNVGNNAASTILKSDLNEISKVISPSEKQVQIEYQSVLPNQSLFYQLNQSLFKPAQQNTQSLYQFSTFNNILKNGIPPPNNGTNNLQQSHSQIQQNIYKLLSLVYNNKYHITNYNYFFQFFKKRTHLETFTNINLSFIIENVVQMLKQEAKLQKIQIYTDYFDNDVKVNTDQNALRQIIYNLLYNAIQNTPKNGFIALRVQVDSKYNDCIKIKIRNSLKQNSPDKSMLSTPYQEDCKFKLEEMISYLKRKGRVNLGLRISQRLIKILGPTDKIILKGEKIDCFQVEFSFYANLNVVQKGSLTQFPSQKALHSSHANSYDKNNNLSEKGLNASNFQNIAANSDGQVSEQPKKNLLGLYQTIFKAQNPFQSQQQDRIINSDQSFDSFVEQLQNQEQAIEQDFERKVFSADRFKHLK